jgi:signal transduction histidine kinase
VHAATVGPRRSPAIPRDGEPVLIPEEERGVGADRPCEGVRGTPVATTLSAVRTRFVTFVARWWSVAIALVFGGIWLAEVLISDLRGSTVTAVTFVVLVSGAFAGARWDRVAALVAVLGLFVVHVVIDPNRLFDSDGAGLIMAAGVCVVGTLPLLRDRIVGVVLTLGLLVLVVVRASDTLVRETDVERWQLLLGNTIGMVILWAIAWAIASRVRVARDLRERAERVEAEKKELAREAVIDERGRIARELHDVVAHSVSVMTVQAGGVRRLLHDDQVREREALHAIEETGRRALDEMRRMVGVMRSDDDGAERAPQPGLADVERLAADIRDAGLPVTVTVDGAPTDLPAGVDLSAYRIVQEALTNTLKHAGPARASVTVHYADDHLELIVDDDGSGPRNGRAVGHGLVGMRERVAVYGGTLEAGPGPSGGYRVHATLPSTRATGGGGD